MSIHREEIKRYQPAMTLDQFCSYTVRHRLRVFLLALLFSSGIAFLITHYGQSIIAKTSFAASTFALPAVYGGIFFVMLAPLVSLYLISFFYNTLYYRGIGAIVKEQFDDESGVTYEVAQVFKEQPEDLTAGFLRSSYGKLALLRTGIVFNELDRFLRSKERTPIPIEQVPIPHEGFVTLEDIGLFIYENDQTFQGFVTKHGKHDELYRGALAWVSRSYLEWKYNRKWWARDNLGKIKGIGRELSFGVAYELQRHMKPLGTSAVFSAFSKGSGYADAVIEKIESALGRTKAANALLVGDYGVGKMDILIELGRRMRDGDTVSSITGKRLIVFDQDTFIATHSSKEAFEASFLKLFAQAERAGNVVVVIDDLSEFLINARSLSVDVFALLDRFLASPHIQLVATVDPGNFHDKIEREGQLVARFETIYIEHPTLESTIHVLEGAAETDEALYDVFFTYPGIVAIAEGADRYISNGVMPEKAVSLLSEVSARARQKRLGRIDKDFVDVCIREKTGIPVGPVGDSEKEALLHLEDRLHERVVGQHGAIKAIASAMRRARAGIQSKDRPLGSFLFLGSTGVGKTETAKALAQVFFGSEERMSRLDMSEYSGPGALEQLIGDSSTSGTLSAMLREHPYGVVLLDEFEKSAPEVHDLFLQVFDEGRFTDGSGKSVNARNAIIIATSNAGSDLIWEITNRGEDPSESKDMIIQEIISANIFKPELINRFDAVVIFKALQAEDIKKISKLMLNDLVARIEKKGYQLEITDGLIEALAEKGYSKEFGARPMRRVIQDEIEEKIASRIISGDLKPGGVVALTSKDIEAVQTPLDTEVHA